MLRPYPALVAVALIALAMLALLLQPPASTAEPPSEFTPTPGPTSASYWPLILRAETTATIDVISETSPPLGTPTVGFVTETEDAQRETEEAQTSIAAETQTAIAATRAIPTITALPTATSPPSSQRAERTAGRTTEPKITAHVSRFTCYASRLA